MFTASIFSRHTNAISCPCWSRYLIGAVPYVPPFQLRPPRRCLGLLTIESRDGAKPSGLEDEANDGPTVAQHGSANKRKAKDSSADRWELTVGIEIHAQLNTERKLFSSARTSLNDEPNSHVSLFDLAFPGSQPKFQKATLVPALRAAVALNCDIQYRSQFDRKHYFYQDQPAGYQITQYYEPYAKDGSITLYDHDGIALEDGASVQVGIKQIQLEQDTAKTINQLPSTSLLDFNRVSHPLIEIITLPQIHHPQTAAACVRKIQAILQAVNAVTTGMEMGGLRADVNVSVQPKFPTEAKLERHVYAGVTGLGQRTEIKNLSSFKAVEDAIIAERNRQIALIESGGVVRGETRGWTIGSTETIKLRGKEGEVDYRFLPDPDLSPLFIGPDLVKHISESLPMLPDESIQELVSVVGLTTKDAKTLVSLDGGERLDYYDEVLDGLGCSIESIKHVLTDAASADEARSDPTARLRKYGKTAANWVLHELGGLLSAAEIPFSENSVSPMAMASIVRNLLEGRVTGTTAKELLAMVFEGDSRDVDSIIMEDNMGFQSLSREVYMKLAQELIEENGELVEQIQRKGKHGKIQWLVGQMMRQGKGQMEAIKAEAILKEILGIGTRK